MTVCIAAICRWEDATPGALYVPIVVGAADRMLTAVDVQYEPPQKKIGSLTKKIVILISGDASIHAELVQSVVKKLSTAPDVTSKDAADLYATELSAYQKKDAETRILMPLGLTFQQFVAHQAQLSPSIVEQIALRLQRHHIDASAIVAGVDSDGPHIYSVRAPGIVTCHDYIGFAAIGIGASHAESQFMFAKYSRDWHFARVLFLTYAAKKRAEVAPGVGQDSDIFYCDINQHWLLYPEHVEELERMYRETQKQAADTMKWADERATKYVKEIVEKASKAQARSAVLKEEPKGLRKDSQQSEG